MAGLTDWLARIRQTVRGDAARPVSRLAAGTLLAQLTPVLLAPVLTRLYSPDAYGALAWAVSIVTIATLVATGCYDQAVNLPPERGTAAALVYAVIGGGACAATVLTMASLVEWAGWSEAPHRLWFVPAATVGTVAFNALSAWCVREACFGVLAAARVILAVAGVAVTLALGCFGWGEAGLMAGNLVGIIAGTAMLLIGTARHSSLPPPAGGLREVWHAAAAYRRFPAFLLPSSLLNSVTNQLPIWFLQRLFGPAVVGQYALMNRVLSVPLSLLSSSAGEVFKQRAAAEFRETGRSVTAWSAFAPPLAWVSVPAGVALLAAGPALFAAVFGETWREAGHYARVLAVFFVLRCFVSPLSYMLIIAQRQKLDLLLQVGCLASALGGLLAGMMSQRPAVALAVFGGGYSAIYLVYFVISRRLALGPAAAQS